MASVTICSDFGAQENKVCQVMIVVKNLPANAGDARNVGLIPGSGRLPWCRKWQPIPAFLSGESHGQRNLAGYSPWGRKESDTTEQLTHTQVDRSFSSKEEASFNFMASLTICSEFGAQDNKVCHCFHFFPPSICQEVMGLDSMILVFLMF